MALDPIFDLSVKLAELSPNLKVTTSELVVLCCGINQVLKHLDNFDGCIGKLSLEVLLVQLTINPFPTDPFAIIPNTIRRITDGNPCHCTPHLGASLYLTTDVKRHWRQPGSDLTCGYTDRPERLSYSTPLTDHSTPCRHPWEVIRPIVSGGTEDAKARNKGDHDCRLIRLPSRAKPDGSSRDLSVWLGS